MKILYLALLALLSTDALVNCNTKQANKVKTNNYNPPVYSPPVITGGLRYNAPTTTTKPAATYYTPIETETETTTTDELPALAPVQMSLFKTVTTLLGKIPTNTTTG